MKPHYYLFVILCLSHIDLAYAEIYKHVGKDGHVTYSSEPIKGSTKLILKPLPAIPVARGNQRATPEDFPKVDSQTQKNRDATRRIILQDELTSEEQLLATTRENLKSIESNPVPLLDPNGIPFRNTAKQTEKIKSAQDLMALHAQNIKALRTEISNLK